MIPRSARRQPHPVVENKPTPETEQIEVTDLALMFTGGHLLPLTVFPEDEFFNAADSPRIRECHRMAEHSGGDGFAAATITPEKDVGLLSCEEFTLCAGKGIE